MVFAHDILDKASWIPGIGKLADAANAALYAFEGNWAQAGMAALGVGKIKKIAKLADAGKARGFIDPDAVRFTQDTIDHTFRDGRSVAGLADDLRKGTVKAGDVPAIRLVQRNGNLYSLDNRRLAAFGEAGVNVPYQMATRKEIREQWARKFTTETDGLSIQLRWSIP